ncbi:hypothetical protein Holit_02576 [Hollandina sp. SP2]
MSPYLMYKVSPEGSLLLRYINGSEFAMSTPAAGRGEGVLTGEW